MINWRIKWKSLKYRTFNKVKELITRYGNKTVAFDRYDEEVKQLLYEEFQKLKELAEIEMRAMTVKELEETSQYYQEYIALVNEYRDMMMQLLEYVINPPEDNTTDVSPLYIINRFMYALDRYQIEQDATLRELYSKLSDVLADWSQKIVLTKHLSLSDIERVLNIALTESEDIYDYCSAFPDLFKKSKVPAELFTEVLGFIAYAYAVLNRVKLPQPDEYVSYIKQYYKYGDSKAIRKLRMWLEYQLTQQYIPFILCNPADITGEAPDKIYLIVEYAENVISKEKRTRYLTLDVFDETEYSRFEYTVNEMKEIFRKTGDLTEIILQLYPEKWNGITPTNFYIRYTKSD